MAVSLVALIVLGLVLLIFSAGIYRAFQGQWWPLALLVCVPCFLFFSYSSLSETHVKENSGSSMADVSLTTGNGERGESAFLEVHPEEEAASIDSYSAAEVRSTHVTWRFGFLSLALIAGLGIFLATKLLSAAKKRHEERGGYQRHGQRREGFPWGMLVGGAACLLVAAIFLLRSMSGVAYERDHAARERARAQTEAAQARAIAVDVEDSSGKLTSPQVIKIDSQRPTSELWEKLTRSRINLDESSDSSDDVQESAVQEESTESEVATTNDAPPPEWITNPPKPVGKVYRVVVSSDPFSTEQECFDQLEEQFYAELQEYMERTLPESQRELVSRQTVSAMGVPVIYFLNNVCRESYVELVESSVGAMKKVHVLMEFDSGVQRELTDKWTAYHRSLGLALVAKISTLVLGTLALGFALLQVDTWTRGYYTTRLLVGVPVAIIAVALLLFS